MKNIFLLITFTVTAIEATKQDCIEASRLSKTHTMSVCDQALKQGGLSPNDQSIILITQAEYLIRNSHFKEANEILDQAFNANPEMLKNGIFRLNWLRIKGSLFVTKEAYADALPFYEQALQVAVIMDNQQLIANGYNDLGAINIELGYYQRALEWLQKSLTIHQENKDEFRTALTLANLAEVFVLIDDHEMAFTYFQGAFNAHQTNLANNPDQAAFYEPYVAHVEQDMGDVMIVLNQHQLAAERLQSALEIYQKYQLVVQQIRVLTTLGKMNLALDQTDQALATLNQAVELEKTLESAEHVELKQTLVHALIDSDQLINAKQVAISGLKMAREKTNLKAQAGFLKSLATINEYQNQIDEALSYQKQFQTIHNQDLKQKYNESLLNLKREIDTSQKQREISLLETEKTKQALILTQQRWGLLATTLLVMLLGLFLFFQIKKKNRYRRLTQKDQENHNQQLQDLSFDSLDLKYLFKHIQSPLICFDLSGMIHYQSLKSECNEPKNNLDIKESCAEVWQAVMQNLNDDDQLTQDLLIKATSECIPGSSLGYQIWIHQMSILDDLIVAVFIDPKDPRQIGASEAEKIKLHSDYLTMLTELWQSGHKLTISQIDQITPLLTVMKNHQPSKDLLKHSNQELRIMAVEIMNTCLDYWQQNTCTGAVDLAEKSGLWLISVDEGRLRIRTLNRYLDINKMPSNPRWQQVVKTAHFVLSSCELDIKQRATLNQLTEQFKQALRNHSKPYKKLRL